MKQTVTNKQPVGRNSQLARQLYKLDDL